MTEHTSPQKVVVIGGGYPGTLAANHLRMRGDRNTPDITLVNPRPKFVERIRLHQHVAGNYDATVDYGTLLGDGIRLVVDTATRIDAASRTVELASGSALDYDYVIYAVGSTGAVPSSVPGASRIRLSHSGVGVRTAAAGRHRRATPRRAGDRRRRGADRDRDGHRARRTGPQGHPGLRRPVGAVAVRAGPSVGGQDAGKAADCGARRQTW